VIYSYNKSQQDELFLKFIFDKELYKFPTDLLSIIRSLNTVYTAIRICNLFCLFGFDEFDIQSAVHRDMFLQ